jgi:hypothetical protein
VEHFLFNAKTETISEIFLIELNVASQPTKVGEKYFSVRKSVSRIEILLDNIMLIFHVTITLKSYSSLISMSSPSYAPLLYHKYCW